MNAWAVIVAAGSGRRFGGAVRKPYLKVGGRPLWWYSLEVFLRHAWIQGIVVAVHPLDVRKARNLMQSSSGKPVIVIPGGAERQDSVKNGLRHLPDGADWVAIHDVARPLLTSAQLTAVLEGARSGGSAVLGIPVSDTTKRENGKGYVLKTVPRKGLWLAQTPQVFRVKWLREAFKKFGKSTVTDDAMLMERMGKPVRLVPSGGWNLKVTTKSDLPILEALLKRRSRM